MLSGLGKVYIFCLVELLEKKKKKKSLLPLFSTKDKQKKRGTTRTQPVPSKTLFHTVERDNPFLPFVETMYF